MYVWDQSKSQTKYDWGMLFEEPQLPTHSGLSGHFGGCVLVFALVWEWHGIDHGLNLGEVGYTQVRNCKKGALLFWAPPCSTWVFLNLGLRGFIKTETLKQKNCGLRWLIASVSGVALRLAGLGSTHREAIPSVFTWPTCSSWGCCMCVLAYRIWHQTCIGDWNKYW